MDANLILYAEQVGSEHHQAARTWWDAQLSGCEPVGLSWPTLNAFIRIATNPRAYQRPLTPREAIDRVQSWLDQPCVRLIHPGDQHWVLFQRMILAGGASGNLVSDAHLAALAVEHNAELFSADADFARFPGLKWRNPIQAGG